MKTFEEIMREKRLRKQQEEQGTTALQKEADSSEPAASPPAPVSSTSVRQRITLKPKTSLPPTAVVPQQKSPERSTCPSSVSPKPPTPAFMPVQVAEGTIQTTETKGTTSDVHLDKIPPDDLPSLFYIFVLYELQ